MTHVGSGRCRQYFEIMFLNCTAASQRALWSASLLSMISCGHTTQVDGHTRHNLAAMPRACQAVSPSVDPQGTPKLAICVLHCSMCACCCRGKERTAPGVMR